MDEPVRFYGTDVTDSLETICEVVVLDNGTYEVGLVHLTKP